MGPDPILEEVWRVKQEHSTEAGHDVRKLMQNTREWAAKNPHPGPTARTPEELQQIFKAEEIRKREEAMSLRETPPPE